MTASRSYYLVEHQARDGEGFIPEAETKLTLADVVSQSGGHGYPIMSVTLLTVTKTQVFSEDVSAEVVRAVSQRYADDELGVPEDWDLLFHRVGRSLESENAEAARERRYSDVRQHSTLFHAAQGIGRL